MLLLLLYFAAAIAVLIQLKLKRTWVKFLVGFLGGFCGSIVLGVVLALIFDSVGNQELGKKIGLAGFTSSLATGIATIIFLFAFQLILNRWKVDTNSVLAELENKLKQSHVYFGLCIVAWVVGVVIANGISELIGNFYAEATIPVIIGFWAGKIVLNNKRRDFVSIAALPIINLIAAFGFIFGHALALQNPESTDFSLLICLIVSFVLSCALFTLINKNNIYGSKSYNNTSSTQNDLEERRKEKDLQRAIRADTLRRLLRGIIIVFVVFVAAVFSTFYI